LDVLGFSAISLIKISQTIHHSVKMPPSATSVVDTALQVVMILWHFMNDLYQKITAMKGELAVASMDTGIFGLGYGVYWQLNPERIEMSEHVRRVAELF